MNITNNHDIGTVTDYQRYLLMLDRLSDTKNEQQFRFFMQWLIKHEDIKNDLGATAETLSKIDLSIFQNRRRELEIFAPEIVKEVDLKISEYDAIRAFIDAGYGREEVMNLPVGLIVDMQTMMAFEHRFPEQEGKSLVQRLANAKKTILTALKDDKNKFMLSTALFAISVGTGGAVGVLGATMFATRLAENTFVQKMMTKVEGKVDDFLVTSGFRKESIEGRKESVGEKLGSITSSSWYKKAKLPITACLLLSGVGTLAVLGTEGLSHALDSIQNIDTNTLTEKGLTFIKSGLDASESAVNYVSHNTETFVDNFSAASSAAGNTIGDVFGGATDELSTVAKNIGNVINNASSSADEIINNSAIAFSDIGDSVTDVTMNATDSFSSSVDGVHINASVPDMNDVLKDGFGDPVNEHFGHAFGNLEHAEHGVTASLSEESVHLKPGVDLNDVSAHGFSDVVSDKFGHEFGHITPNQNELSAVNDNVVHPTSKDVFKAEGNVHSQTALEKSSIADYANNIDKKEFLQGHHDSIYNHNGESMETFESNPRVIHSTEGHSLSGTSPLKNIVDKHASIYHNDAPMETFATDPKIIHSGESASLSGTSPLKHVMDKGSIIHDDNAIVNSATKVYEATKDHNTLWDIAKNHYHDLTGTQPTDKQIVAMINDLGIKDPNNIDLGQHFSFSTDLEKYKHLGKVNADWLDGHRAIENVNVEQTHPNVVNNGVEKTFPKTELASKAFKEKINKLTEHQFNPG
jgi:hypothetical protein